MKFIDSAKIMVAAGSGGKGCVAWHREKFKEFGGPSGGNGGRGGDIFFKGNPGLYTLYDLKMNFHLSAKNGAPGSGRAKNGKSGEDLIINVPLGTSIYDASTKELLLDIITTEKKLLLAGGRGGKGNLFFKSQKNNAPDFAQPGETGKKLLLQLDLKVLADIGLVGFPNAGKSSFLASSTSATPKVAAYPFTTLTPSLGIVYFPESHEKLSIADIPGIQEGASKGVGLGINFLKHILRTKVLAFLLDISDYAQPDPITAYSQLLSEIESFSSKLLDNKQVIVLTKKDLIRSKSQLESLEKVIAYFKELNLDAFLVSSVTKEGIDQALKKFNRCLKD